MSKLKSSTASPKQRITTNKCGRTGCPSEVKNGIQCHLCLIWWHFKCTGLKEDQVDQLANSTDPFVCTSCLYRQGSAQTSSSRVPTAHRPASPTKQKTKRCDCSTQIKALDSKLSAVCRAMAESNFKYVSQWDKIENELASLNEFLALSIPGPLAAKKVLQLSDTAVKDAAKSLVDRRLREARLILWGSFSEGIAPTDLAKNYLANFLPNAVHDSLYADWLRSKKTRKAVGLLITLSSPNAVRSTLKQTDRIQEFFPEITRISQDRTLEVRKATQAAGKGTQRKHSLASRKPVD
jgi:hypothetical protein